MTLEEAGPYLISLGASAIQNKMPDHAMAIAVAMDAVATMSTFCEVCPEFKAAMKYGGVQLAFEAITRRAKESTTAPPRS